MRRLALLGASGHGKVVADSALCSGWDEVVFFDDAYPNNKNIGSWSIMGDSNALLGQLSAYDGVIVSIGDCRIRLKKQQMFKAFGARLATVIHRSATVSPYAKIGLGTVVMAGAIVNIDSFVGDACIINTGATVDHDCHLIEAVHICPGAHLSGNVRIGTGSWIGVGACVKQGIVIGDNVMVGAGSVVVESIADNQIVFGNPARSHIVPSSLG